MARSASTPPTGGANRVSDLGISDNGDGTYTLSWHYRNLGDYDQNGVVALEDIYPLAQHFGETYDPEAEPHCLQAVIDGSGDSWISEYCHDPLPSSQEAVHSVFVGDQWGVLSTAIAHVGHLPFKEACYAGL